MDSIRLWRVLDAHVIVLGLVFVGLPPAVAALPSTNVEFERLLQLPIEELVEIRVGVASHFDEPQLNSGATVSVISSQQWEKRGARRLLDAVGAIPGTVVLPNWFGAEHVMIRGYANGNNSGGIATLWDDVPVSSVEGSPQYNRQFINLGTLDRIELIRGPGSALHGENAFHGVLSMRAFESATDLTRIESRVASNDYYHWSGKHGQGIGSGVRLHASAAITHQGNQHQTYQHYEPVGQSERANAYLSSTTVLKLTSDPTHDLTWNAGIYTDNIHADGFLSGGTSGSSGLDGRDLGGVDSGIKIVKVGAGVKLNSTTQANASAYYWFYDRTYQRATSLTRDLTGTGGANDAGTKIILKQSELFGNTQWSLALDLRHQQMDGAHRKIVDSGSGVIVDEDLQFKDFTRTIVSTSLDANTELFNKLLQLRYGGRADKYSDFGTQMTPRLGAIVHPTATSALKVLYGKGFRAPNALEVKGSATIEGNSTIEPEVIDTYEGVFQYKTADTLTEFVLFKSDWKNSIVTTSTTTPGYTQRYVNSGDSRAHGAEASFVYQSTPWTIETSGSYTRSENTSLHQDYSAFPMWIVNGGIGYELSELRTEFFLNARVHLDTDEAQITSTYPQPQPLKKYLRGDLHVKTRFNQNFAVTLDIRNLANRDNRLASIQTNPSPGGIPEEERSVMLGLLAQI